MTYDHPTKVEELHPGYFVVTYTPQAISTPEGILVPPGSLIIPPEIPADLLRALANEKDGLTPPLTPFDDDTDDTDTVSLSSRVVNLLSADSNGKLRMKELTEALGCTADEIKALDGQGFTIGHAGWVALKNEGGEA